MHQQLKQHDSTEDMLDTLGDKVSKPHILFTDKMLIAHGKKIETLIPMKIAFNTRGMIFSRL